MKSKSDFDKSKNTEKNAPSSEMDSADVATGNPKPESTFGNQKPIRESKVSYQNANRDTDKAKLKPDVQGQNAKTQGVSEEQ